MEIVNASDRALLVRLDNRERVIALAQLLEGCTLAGVTSYSPAYKSVLVRYEPAATDPELLKSALGDLARQASAHVPSYREVVLPVTFDGIDLPELASLRGFRPADVVDIFCSTEYRVYFLGFVPGFAYMGDVDERISAPRRPAPRKSVPAGSVGIAGRQTGVYPLETPGGWNLIGRCAVPMFAAGDNAASLLRPGDRVRFVPA